MLTEAAPRPLTKSQRPPALLDHRAERHVIGGLEPQMLESRGRVEDTAANQGEATASHGDLRGRIAHGGGADGHRDHAHEDRPEHVEDPAAAAKLGHERQQVVALGLAVRHRPAQHARLNADVGVGEQQPFAGGHLDASGQRVHLAEPPVGQRLDANRLAREGLGERTRR